MKVEVDPKKASKEQIAAGLALLEKQEVRKSRIASGELKGGQTWSELTPEVKAKRLESSKKREAKRSILCVKATEAGIVATEAEIQEELDRRAALRAA